MKLDVNNLKYIEKDEIKYHLLKRSHLYDFFELEILYVNLFDSNLETDKYKVCTNIGQNYLINGKFQEAKELFETIILENCHSNDIANLLTTYIYLNEQEKGLEFHKQFDLIKGRNISLNLSKINQNLNNFDEALCWLNRAYFNYHNLNYLLNKILILFKSENYEEVLRLIHVAEKYSYKDDKTIAKSLKYDILNIGRSVREDNFKNLIPFDILKNNWIKSLDEPNYLKPYFNVDFFSKDCDLILEKINTLYPFKSGYLDKYYIEFDHEIGTYRDKPLNKVVVKTFSNTKDIVNFYPTESPYHRSEHKVFIK